MGVRHRVLVAGEHLARDQAGEVGHVDHEGRADLVGDLPHLGEVDPPGVRGVAGDQHQWPELPGDPAHLVVVDQLGRRVGAVGALVEHLARDVGPEAVGQVAACVERHAQRPLVAELAPQRLPLVLGQIVDALHAPVLGQRRSLDPVGEDGPEGDQVGVDAGVRLGVRVLGPEQLAGVLGGQRLDGVDVLAAGVEAVPDGALGVLVGQPGAHGQQHGGGGVVLRGDQLERGALVGQLGPGRVGDPGLHLPDDRERRAVCLRRGCAVVHGGVGRGEDIGHRTNFTVARQVTERYSLPVGMTRLPGPR